MRRSTKERRRKLRYGQAILLGVRIEREVDQAYTKPRWYAFLSFTGRHQPICGPWGTRHQAVTHALEQMGVFQ